MKTFIRQLFHFTYAQVLACIFPAVIFLTLAVTKLIDVPLLPRYDFILLVFVLAQVIMYKTGLETKDELKVITVFHIIGLLLEIYKVHMGSWSYPEAAITKVFGVPLYSGFMYASVASYMIQSWRHLDLRMTKWPPAFITVPVGAMIYVNFFTHHYIYDFRWVLKIVVIVVFFRTVIFFTVNRAVYRMPLALAFVLIGFFIWIAENIATFFGAWQYPGQEQSWELVHIGKISSWLLLVIVSFIIVAQLKHVKELLSQPEKINSGKLTDMIHE